MKPLAPNKTQEKRTEANRWKGGFCFIRNGQTLDLCSPVCLSPGVFNDGFIVVIAIIRNNGQSHFHFVIPQHCQPEDFATQLHGVGCSVWLHPWEACSIRSQLSRFHRLGKLRPGAPNNSFIVSRSREFPETGKVCGCLGAVLSLTLLARHAALFLRVWAG